MDSFTVTKLNKTPGEVLDAAYRRPVELTEHGRRKYVVMAADHYDRLIRTDPRKPYYLPDAPDQVKAEILTALDVDDEPQP
jgi:prevent-host-death family protein